VRGVELVAEAPVRQSARHGLRRLLSINQSTITAAALPGLIAFLGLAGERVVRGRARPLGRGTELNCQAMVSPLKLML